MDCFRVSGLFSLLCWLSASSISAQSPLPFQFQSAGVKLPGSSFYYDASLDVLDWNQDGKQDIFLLATGTVGGSVNFNEGTSAAPRFGHAVYYPFNSTETFPQTIEHVSAYTFCDLDHNGLFDIIFFDGQLRYCPNTGTANAPFHWKLWQDDPQERSRYFPGTEKFTKENARYSTGPESMFWKKGIFARQVLTLTAADWDGDGLQDLLISRFKEEAPGVKSLGVGEQWTAWARLGTQIPTPGTPKPAPEFLAPLQVAPARGLYFYRNLGTKERPKFDEGLEITTADGQSIAAPNPVVADLDGEGVPSILSTEVNYRCNAFRVDWPTSPHVQIYRRTRKDSLRQVQPAVPLQADGRAVPAGTAVRVADFRSRGIPDVLVMHSGGFIRWYQNQANQARSPVKLASAKILRGTDFGRFDFMTQPVVVDWYGPGSRDLLLHGTSDGHCKWGLRRTALFRNKAQRPGDIDYEFVGNLNFQGDEAMVPVTEEEHHYEIYGSSIAVYPTEKQTSKRIVMSVGGRLYQFDDLAPDGLTFRTMNRIPLAAENNRFFGGWQEVPVNVPEKVRFIRLQNELNGLGVGRDGFLHILRFEAYAGGQNIAVPGAVVVDYVRGVNDNYRVADRAENMFHPDNANTPKEFKATTFGYYVGPAVLKLKEPVALERIRFLFSERDTYWYQNFVPFYWQGKDYRFGMEENENWYQYQVEVSADGVKWTNVVDRRGTEMWYTHPTFIDWDRDGKADLLLGVTTSLGGFPRHKTYRLYRNIGTNERPLYRDFEPILNEKGEPLVIGANWGLRYDPQCGVAVIDDKGQGQRSLLLYSGESTFDVYRQESTADSDLKFKWQESLALNGQRIHGRGYVYFQLQDVDGDATRDLIVSSSANLAFYKGTSQTAPPRTTDLRVLSVDSTGVKVTWTQPAGAKQFHLRWSSDAPISELNWNRLPGIKGEYPHQADAAFSVTLPQLPNGTILNLALKSVGDNASTSGISDSTTAAAPPWKLVAFRNGPAGSIVTPEYSGTEAVKLVAEPGAGTTPPASDPILEVRAQDSNRQKGQESVILIRFKDLPKLGKVQRATLELTVEPGPTPTAMSQLAISCNSFSKSWEPATATWAQAKAGSPWAREELERGGTCRAFLAPVFMVQTPRRTWDVTSAVQQAQSQGENQINLLVRVDYTGHYVAGQGMRFCGPNWQDVGSRPKLVLVTE